MAVSRQQFQAFQSNLREIVDELKQKLVAAKEVKQKAKREPASPAVEATSPEPSGGSASAIIEDINTDDQHTALLGEWLAAGDIALLGLGACRLGAAADHYISSGGEYEDDTFPCDGSNESVLRNLEVVRKARERLPEIIDRLDKLHEELVARSAASFIQRQTAWFNQTAAEFLEEFDQ